jgi:F-type H+-transporting ATPase subunit delta
MARTGSSARRYAEAAFQLAERDDAIEPWLRHLQAAAAALGDERIVRPLENPAVPLEQREKAISAAVKGAPVQVRNLLLLLLRRNRLELLPRVAAEYKRLYDRREGITPAIVTSAAPLDKTEVKEITDRLRQLTDGQVELDLRVDPSLLGGVVVRLGDQLLDGSVRGRLERLRTLVATGAIAR